MPRIDAHVHAFPDRLALAVRERLNRGGVLTAGPLLPAVARQVLAEGFDGAWILPYAHRAGVAESANEWSAAACAEYPWLVAGATFHPADDELGRLAERALVELALRVVKLHCSVGGFSVADRRLEPLWQIASAQEVPVVVHAGRRGPGETAADELGELEPVLREHPELRLVLAHAGHPATPHALALMEHYDNLYADLTPVWARCVQIAPEQIEACAGRLLFGSDAPNNPVGAREQAARFETMELSDEARALLLGGTAGRLVTSPLVLP